MHEGVDEDHDGEPDWIPDSVPDWIPVYTVSPDDPGGNWLMLWTGADACGAHSPHRRTHDHPRMLVANDPPRRPYLLNISTDFTTRAGGTHYFRGVTKEAAKVQQQYGRATRGESGFMAMPGG